jgi:hypothetical protein
MNVVRRSTVNVLRRNLVTKTRANRGGAGGHGHGDHGHGDHHHVHLVRHCIICTLFLFLTFILLLFLNLDV